MTRIGSPRESRDPSSIAHGRRHYLRVSDVATSATRAASGSRGMTSYVYGSELDIIVCASGAGVAGTSRRRSLSRLASDCRARERPRRSEKTPLYLLATGLDRPCYFGRRKDRLPRTALPLRLARGHQRAAPDRGRVSFEEVARRHPAYASTMLFGHRLVARDCHKSILATSARQDWRLARAPSSTGYGDIALRAAKCPSSMSFPPSVHAEDSFSEGRPRHPWFRQRRRIEVRAFVAPAPHHRRRPASVAARSLMRGLMGRGQQQ